MVASVSVSFYTLKLSVIPCPPPTMISLDDEINYLFSSIWIYMSSSQTAAAAAHRVTRWCKDRRNRYKWKCIRCEESQIREAKSWRSSSSSGCEGVSRFGSRREGGSRGWSFNGRQFARRTSPPPQQLTTTTDSTRTRNILNNGSISIWSQINYMWSLAPPLLQ